MTEIDDKIPVSPEILDGKTILIVDDDPNIPKAIARLIKQESRNCTVITTESVKSAIRLIQEGLSPDLIISDMMMPEGTGKDLHDWLVENNSDLSRKIMFLSGGMSDGVLRNFFDVMMSAGRAHEKPFDSERFRAQIKKLLSQEMAAPK